MISCYHESNINKILYTKKIIDKYFYPNSNLDPNKSSLETRIYIRI